MEEVRVYVIREIKLDGNLQPIPNQKVYDQVYLSCDDLDIFLETVRNVEELEEILSEEYIKDIVSNRVKENEKLIFMKAFKETKGTYKFNDRIMVIEEFKNL